MGTSLNPTYFVRPSKVVGRMQVNAELEGVQDAILSALVGAQLHVETVLESRLSVQTWDCRYYLDSEAFSGMQPNGAYQLELPSGFVRQDQPITITSDDTWAMPTQLAVASTSYIVDYVRGLVVLGQADYDGKYIRVQCTTGFNPGDPDDIEESPPEDIPDWLEEAIISYTAVIFDTTQTTNRNAEASATYKRAGDHAMAVLSPYLRKRGFMFRAISGL